MSKIYFSYQILFSNSKSNNQLQIHNYYKNLVWVVLFYEIFLKKFFRLVYPNHVKLFWFSNLNRILKNELCNVFYLRLNLLHLSIIQEETQIWVLSTKVDDYPLELPEKKTIILNDS